MKNNNFTRDTKSAKGETSTAGQLREDKFEALWTKRDVKPAMVSVGVHEGIDYGAMKVSATVSLNCDQNEPTIDKAGELAFFKALELVRDGWRVLKGEG